MRKYSVYQGHPCGKVTVNGGLLNPCLDIVNHSPDGFSWGFNGSGPAQLALAIACEEFGCDLGAHPISYQIIKIDLISRLPKGEPFNLTSADIWSIVASRIGYRG